MIKQELLAPTATIAQPVRQESMLQAYDVTFTTVLDETDLYKQLSTKLIKIEKTKDYTVSHIQLIEEKAQQMLIHLAEKAELLQRCDWLYTMKKIEAELATMTTLNAVKMAQSKLGCVQTCPLKNELKSKLAKLEEYLQEPVKIFSPREQLVEAVFTTGNETFINLGSIGREFVLTAALKENPIVENVIAKAEELEIKVQSIKNVKSIDELRQALQGLPLQYFLAIPLEYEEEVLQLLFNNSNWNGLFQLDLQIKHISKQIQRKYSIVQEGVMTTLVMDEKVMEQLGVQQL